MNQMIEQRKIFDLLGRSLGRKLDGLLVNADFSYGYPIHNEVLQLVRDEAIVLENPISGQIRDKMTSDLNPSE
ncbi:MAG: hypothetical protein GY768_13525 [Planctomycetaceae bacterium]|nr:hypothetical protein [Planctomycetaceae bacterium]